MKPSAPVLLEVVGLTDDSVTLSWLSPERDGGSRIRGYVIECREVGAGAVGVVGWTTVKRIDSSDVLVACVEGLRVGVSYRFRVYAENEAGSGPAVELRQPVVPRSQLGNDPAGRYRFTASISDVQSLLDSAMHDLFVKMQDPDHCLHQIQLPVRSTTNSWA